MEKFGLNKSALTDIKQISHGPGYIAATNLKGHHLLLFDVPVLAVSINNITDLSSKARLVDNRWEREVFQFTGIPGGKTANVDGRIYGEVSQHEIIALVLDVLRLPQMIQSEADFLPEQPNLQLVPDPVVEVLAHGQGLGSAAKVKPTPQATRDQLELQEVVVASIIEVDQQAV